jgi:hypothetical protein
MSQVAINIIAEFLGKKAFKQADTATQQLTKNVKKLAGAFGVAFGAQQFISYGKRAVKAFAESEQEATRLRTAVTNLGLAFAAPEVDRYIDKIELATGVNRDQLQPSFLTLLRTTGSLAKSQELLNLSLDIAASEGLSVTAVAEKLSQAYVGQARGLRSLNLGLTTAELNTADFEFIQRKLTTLFAGQGEAAANSYTASIAKLGIASEQASEIIGGGLVDSLIILSGNTSVDDLAEDMLNAARNTRDFQKSLSELINFGLAPIKFFALGFTELVKATDPLVDLIIEGDPSGFMKRKPQSSLSAPVAGFNGKTFYADAQKNAQAIAKAETTAKKRAAELLAIKKKQQALEGKITKDKKIQQAIDKANLALLKGEEIFDMDKIQIAAALTNQAEQLGKATSTAQVLQIANDTARLNVKRSILALEDAIAAKDEAAIVAATNKLNADLKVLGALSMQNVKLIDIKSILDTLKPVDLINQSNLDKALASIQEMLRLLAQANTQAKAAIPTSASLSSGITAGDYIAPISTAGGSIGAILEYAEAATARANAFADLLDMENASAASSMASSIDLESIARSSLLQGLAGGAGVSGAVSGSRYAAQAANAYNITIQAGIGDPEAIARAVEDVVRQSYQRGTSATGLLAV